jgi:hypothetical protein
MRALLVGHVARAIGRSFRVLRALVVARVLLPGLTALLIVLRVVRGLLLVTLLIGHGIAPSYSHRSFDRCGSASLPGEDFAKAGLLVAELACSVPSSQELSLLFRCSFIAYGIVFRDGDGAVP